MAWCNKDDKISVITPTDELTSIPLSILSWESRLELNRGFETTVWKIVYKQYLANLRDILRYLNYVDLWEEIKSINKPTLKFLQHWSEDLQHKPEPSIGKLVEILTLFERFDILHDVTDLIYSDIQSWRDRCRNISRPLMFEESPHIAADKAAPDDTADEDLVTVNDAEVEKYDAIFSYNDNDDHSKMIMERMHRDLVINFGLNISKGEHGVGSLKLHEKMRFINFRCHHVIVLLCRSYLKRKESYEELYYMKFRDPMAYERKIVPVLIENIKMPDLLSDMVFVPYYDKRKLSECYESLYEALKKR